MKKILILLTNHPSLGETDERNGTYAPELTHALKEILDAGFEYELASIKGGVAPIYGEDIDDALNTNMLADEELSNKLNNTLPVSQLSADHYGAVFYPGGFGLLSDLATDESAARVSAEIFESGGVVGAVCHGPAALLPIKLSDGSHLLDKVEVTCFTREEEVDFGTIDKIPFLLEDALVRQSKAYRKTKPWQVNIVEQDRIITGQNPASAAEVGKAMVRRLA